MQESSHQKKPISKSVFQWHCMFNVITSQPPSIFAYRHSLLLKTISSHNKHTLQKETCAMTNRRNMPFYSPHQC